MKRAFTLIELLVVVAIIGLLSSVILASLNSARARSYDVKRISDLRQIQSALEAYFSATGSYPSTAGSWKSQCNGYTQQFVAYEGAPKSSGIVPNYISSFPADPQMKSSGNLNPSSSCCYAYVSDGANYDVLDYNCSTSDTSNASLASFKDPYNTSMWSVRSSDAAALANSW